MSTRGDIRELVEAGALSAAAIAEKTGAANVPTVLYQMVAAGQLSRKGRGDAALYGPGTGKKKRAAKKKAKGKAGGGRGPKRATRTARVKRTPAPPFRALLANGGALVCVRGGEFIEFTEAETLEISNAVQFAYSIANA